ncbi:hypothetical protein N7499_008834 [Penicillium canescens]|uniref:Uncharacterized protein n=1 Tax=Penicillium arizonense TaxID=1835702 RepID=A0A1F5LTA0_PENAI|nr:hypothetical protein PENARI_c003G07029 [Penicillium arizonense]KAJ6001640.1 hypothetical protein N7522_006867 [Penicillium canescens]KAJ6076853.1 hypothetical protein N7499_008834 [Penicillium canescens]KAJ6159160.1 hypothetical protein N7485_011986 [Penicillium canescens]OGE56434.1 hypothetical protein PENARI_c003G07029 [Penicillium arizonense]
MEKKPANTDPTIPSEEDFIKALHNNRREYIEIANDFLQSMEKMTTLVKQLENNISDMETLNRQQFVILDNLSRDKSI